MTDRPEVGKTYRVNHSRKGTFTYRVTGVNGEWVDGVIVTGVAGAMLAENVREEGEPLTVRTSLCTFAPLASPERP